jgi:hypothetical protein
VFDGAAAEKQMPPARGVDHAIALLPGMAPPDLPARRLNSSQLIETRDRIKAGLASGRISITLP